MFILKRILHFRTKRQLFVPKKTSLRARATHRAQSPSHSPVVVAAPEVGAEEAAPPLLGASRAMMV